MTLFYLWGHDIRHVQHERHPLQCVHYLEQQSDSVANDLQQYHLLSYYNEVPFAKMGER
ncbi:hypothetical protein D3C75_1087480 [compost metagenome]